LRTGDGEPNGKYPTDSISHATRQPSPLALVKMLHTKAPGEGIWDLDQQVKRALNLGRRYWGKPRKDRTWLQLPGVVLNYFMQFIGKSILGLATSLTPLMCAVQSQRFDVVLLLLHMRELKLVRFSLDAVNSKSETVAQMSTELPITDMTVLIQVLDGAEYEQERRKSLIREVKQNGLTRELMLHVVAAANSQPAATKALLQAAERTPRWDDAQEVSSEVMQENLDEIGPH
jgi:hypothetical protein